MSAGLNTELSTLMALARFRGGKTMDDQSRQQLINRLPTDWGKKMACAMLGDEGCLTPDEQRDLSVVRQLAGVAR